RVFAPEYIYLVSTDYIRPLAFGRIEAGVSGRLRNMPINYTVTKDPSNTALLYDFGNWSKWDEQLVGSYINLVAEFAKINIEAGLRGEYTGISYKFAPNPYFEEDEYDYFSFFPNTRFTYNINKSNKISLFYNRRVDRPGEDILRIFPKYDDPELLKIGNPSLRPQFTQNLELTYRYLWTNGSLYSSLYHKIIDNYFTRVYIQDPVNPEITIKAYDNLGMATNTGIESGIDQRITQAWKLSASINIYTNRIYAHEGTIRFPAEQTYSIKERKDIPLYFKITNQVTLPHDLAFELTGQYFTAKNIGQGRELSRGGLDFGMKKSFLSKKLEMNLTISDIFNTMGLRQTISGQGFTAEYQNYYETQVLSLALRYKF
ncbi:MAG TPA: outer membrane beta-barrel family protein, partial [Bacteroidales bacterium]|nr:outer membrane beta-barrel family protein [Bacteroidales bacterium]